MKAGINLPEGFYTVDEKPCEIFLVRAGALYRVPKGKFTYDFYEHPLDRGESVSEKLTQICQWTFHTFTSMEQHGHYDLGHVFSSLAGNPYGVFILREPHLKLEMANDGLAGYAGLVFADQSGDLLYAPNLGHLKAIYEIQRGSKEYSERIYKVNINSQHTFYPLCFDLTERIIALLP